MAYVVQGADVRMVQAGDGARLAVEAPTEVGVVGEVRGEILTATVRSSRVSFARYTSPIPPAPQGDRISYGPSRVPELRAILKAL